METQSIHNLYERPPIYKSKAPAVKWFKQWVLQDVAATGGKCMVFKWVKENQLTTLKEKSKEQPELEPEPEPTTEVLFLCSGENCGKTFVDAAALRKHAHIHAERQHTCPYEGCFKKFLDNSKLKRHLLTHTGERDFVCPIDGCGKAFSLDFNLRSHMKTHSQENYHLCPYTECGKRFAHEYKLKNHISAHHEKRLSVEPMKYATPPEKTAKVTKPSPGVYATPTPERPYACPHEGCIKAYIHEYKLKLHLRKEHPSHMSDENAENASPNTDNYMDEPSDQDVYVEKRMNGRSQKQSRHKPNLKMPVAKRTQRKGSGSSPPRTSMKAVKRHWPVQETHEEEDSEETEEEDRDNAEDGWRYGENNGDDNGEDGWRYRDNNGDDNEETDYED
ncbi:zinc finger transcription factor YY1-like [Mercurialis annua]|uniref:zinc finger transcription factor YY1-like n=1 Tax=Mercurialis annua TaxID=3986 RepID=UPI00216041BF|nr:zinc finger transcription factor YY1-like [Mercurialis annua]